MQLLRQQVSIPSSLPNLKTSPVSIVIVGTGPVGIRAAQELLRRAPHHPLVLYGNEPWAPYNRVQLSCFLAGDTTWQDLDNTLHVPPGSTVIQRHHCAVVSIDPTAHTVTDAAGRIQPYSSLILALGARPHVPSIPGADLSGVYVFHDMNDAQRLLARSTRSHRALVLGGGVLGLEAARALQRRTTEVTIIQHTDRLMGKQLDEAASSMLLERLRSLGMQILLGESIQSVLGEWTVTGVRLRSGTVLPCDTLVIATGIKPNTQLALATGLHIGQGITVDDCMRTSEPSIYAIGDCAEHRSRIYGLVAPGLEQAAVAAHCVLGGVAHYHGSQVATQLKIVDLLVFSAGRVGEEEPALSFQTVTHERRPDGVYRKLVLHGGKLVGAVAIGDWPERMRAQEALSVTRRLWPWQLARFRLSGALWPAQQATSITEWPQHATVCICT
ncbi:MAG: NAD(P)/FAD-dependent oxidoreductase, partial [Candidatus Binatia bacterium]